MPIRMTPSQGTIAHYSSFTNAIQRIDSILFLCCIVSLFWGFVHFIQKSDTFYNPVAVYDMGPTRGIRWSNTVTDYHADVAFFSFYCFPALTFTFFVGTSLLAWSIWNVKLFYRLVISISLMAAQATIVTLQWTGDPSIKWRWAYIDDIPEWVPQTQFKEQSYVDMWQNVNTNPSRFMMIASGFVCLAVMISRLLLDARIVIDRYKTHQIHLPYHTLSDTSPPEKSTFKGKGRRTESRPTSSHSLATLSDPTDTDIDTTTQENTFRNRSMFATSRPSMSSLRSYFRSSLSRRASASMPASARQSTETELRSVWSMVRASSPRPSLFTLLDFPLEGNASRLTLPAYSPMPDEDAVMGASADDMPDAENVDLIAYNEGSDAGDVELGDQAQASTSTCTSSSTEASLHMSDRYSATAGNVGAEEVGNVGVPGQPTKMEEMLARCMREQEDRFVGMMQQQARRYEALMAEMATK